MQVGNVTNEDGIQAATLLKILEVARFDGVSGVDIEKFSKAKTWFAGIGKQMAEVLKDTSSAGKSSNAATRTPTAVSAPLDKGFKVKSLNTAAGAVRRKKK